MNYLKEINSLYDKLETNPLSAHAITLWHALMATANKAGWVSKFAVAISTLEAKTSLNKKAIERARNELSQKGYIEWNKRNGNQSAEYSINSLCDKKDIDFVPQSVPQSVSQNVPQSVAINKNYISISLKGENRFVFESLNPLMEDLLNDPVIIEDFQRSIGSPYPPPETVKDLIKEFFVKLTVDGEESKDRKNAIYHFKSWYRQNLESKNKRMTYEQTQKTGATSGFKLVR